MKWDVDEAGKWVSTLFSHYLFHFILRMGQTKKERQ